MANYLCILRHEGRSAAEGRLTENLLGPSEEIAHRTLAGGWHLSWIAKGAESDLLPGTGLFSGFAVDDGHERIMYGARGVLAEGRPALGDGLPGCYISAAWDQHGVDITADLYRSMSIFVTSVPGLTMVSDSAYVLMEMRRRLRLPVVLDEGVARAMLWRNSMSGQLLGSRTPVKDIRYVPVGRHVRLPLDSPSCTALEVGRPVPEIFSPPSTDYAAELRLAGIRIGSLINTVASSGPEHARLSLSGGKDSRICLAAALLSPAARDSARYSCTNTSEQHRRDYEVVTELSTEFGFPLGARGSIESRSDELRRVANPLALWFSDNCLSYYPLRIQAYALRAKGRFAIAGFGSELYKGNYGQRPLQAIVTSIARTQPEVAESVRSIAEEVLVQSGIDPRRHLSAEWHYLLLRNAIHGGRFTPVSKFGLRPLQQRNLVGLSKVSPDLYSPLMTGPEQVPDDLLVLLSPSLAARPFDRPVKDRSPHQVVERLRLLGGPISSAELSTYHVSGNPHDVADGPSTTLLGLVDASRIRGRVNRDGVRPLIDDAARVVAGSGLSEQWSSVAEEMRRTVRDPSIPLGHTHGMPGRLLALAEVLR
ncbi:hypothetical protein FCK90_13800 [Kocuria coralli]|uniref:Asparagine synthetase domain-containing protein n=1 Tax=Kocuria coralli TaxID=1461025 RepID=A0A5J5KV68_9MICC|nr:hypothetical protein [Kocuria coralli]KAA9393120.1 hypothetical protein FCK90_13800 [Kocuria coralli]